MKVRFTRPALADLDAILDNIARNSPQGARRVQRRIASVIALLAEHPGIGRLTDDHAIRRQAAHPFPYLIFYEATGDEVIVHAVRHGARNPSTMPGANDES